MKRYVKYIMSIPLIAILIIQYLAMDSSYDYTYVQIVIMVIAIIMAIIFWKYRSKIF